MSENDDQIALAEFRKMLESIRTRDDFYDFLESHHAEIDRDKEFGTMLHINAVDGMATYMYGNESIPEEPSWRVFAEILIRGMYYG